jgi:hypothetical protein
MASTLALLLGDSRSRVAVAETQGQFGNQEEEGRPQLEGVTKGLENLRTLARARMCVCVRACVRACVRVTVGQKV